MILNHEDTWWCTVVKDSVYNFGSVQKDFFSAEYICSAFVTSKKKVVIKYNCLYFI